MNRGKCRLRVRRTRVTIGRSFITNDPGEEMLVFTCMRVDHDHGPLGPRRLRADDIIVDPDTLYAHMTGAHQ